MSGANKTSTRRPNREEIVDLFRACAAKNDGMAPGKGLFQKTSGVTEAQVKYHFWKGGYTELAQEAGLEPNLFNQTRLDDDQVFSDYAKICLHIQSVPNERQLRGAQRELGARTHTVGTRFDGWLEEFQQRFRHWLANQRPELRTIWASRDGVFRRRTVLASHRQPLAPGRPFTVPSGVPAISGCSCAWRQATIRAQRTASLHDL